MTTIHQLVERARHYSASGASVSILTAEGRVDGERCDRLVELPGVRAAGALRTTTTHLTPTVLPRAPIPVSDASAGFTAVLGASAHTAGVLLGPEAAESLGVTGPGTIATPTADIRVAGTFPYPDDGRRPGLSYAAIAPTTGGKPFDECWVDTWPSQDVHSALLTTIRLGQQPKEPPTLSQLNASLGESFDGHALFEQRITRFAGIAAALGGLALGLSGVRIRRLSLASALHAGVSRRALYGIVTAETMAWFALSAALVIPLTSLFAMVVDGGLTNTLPAGMVAVCPLWLGGFAGAWMGTASIQERHLFRYFTTR
jgi:hypothetical protein